MTPRTLRSRALAVATFAVVVGSLTGGATAAPAVTNPACKVTNLTTRAVYTGGGTNLQTAIDAANPGVSLRIQGACAGNFDTNGKDLSLVGATSKVYPHKATLDGGRSGTVLTVPAGALSVRNLRIMHGSAGSAGGIVNSGNLRLLGSTIVTLNNGGAGVSNEGTLTMNGHTAISGNKTRGAVNGGTFTMNDSSSIAGNRAANGQGGTGGGVINENLGATFTMNDSSSITGNDATYEGGGIFDAAILTMNDASTISGNTAGVEGGGVYDQGTGTLNGVVDGGNVFSNAPDDVFHG